MHDVTGRVRRRRKRQDTHRHQVRQPGLGFKKSGTYVGFDVDVAKYVAKKLGYSEDEIVSEGSPLQAA